METHKLKESHDDLLDAGQSNNHTEGESTNTEDSEDTEFEEGIKLFIGQVPKTMDETGLFTVLEQFGPMADVTIIRDKNTLQHRGCAFVTFLKLESAEACTYELHEKVILDGGKKPVQVSKAIKGGGKWKFIKYVLSCIIITSMFIMAHAISFCRGRPQNFYWYASKQRH